MKTLPEKFKTYGNVFDEFTLRNLFRLSSMGLFEELKSTVSLGKEANVFTAIRADGSLVVVKIYRLQNCNFNKMWSYFQTDPRFSNDKPRRREIIFAWTQREYRNLLRARSAHVRVPTPYKFLANILVQEFIGDGVVPAKQLKDVDPTGLFDPIIDMMRLLWKSGIVHGDLSAYNILVHFGAPVFIDMSQSTDSKDSNALEYLRRDVENICTFFSRDDCDAVFEKVRDVSR